MTTADRATLMTTKTMNVDYRRRRKYCSLPKMKTTMMPCRALPEVRTMGVPITLRSFLIDTTQIYFLHPRAIHNKLLSMSNHYYTMAGLSWYQYLMW